MKDSFNTPFLQTSFLEKDVFDTIKAHEGERFVYGTGDGADKLIDYLDKINVPIDGVCVSDSFYRKRTFRNMEVIPVSRVCENHKDALLMMAFGTKETEEVFKLSKRVKLIYPEFPVVGSFPFTKEKATRDIKRIENAYRILSDDNSRKVFECILRFRLTGDINLLKECESPLSEGYELVLKNGEEKIFDCGAYTGDTAEDFLKYSKNTSFIYALEPCPKSYKKLKDNLGRLKEEKYPNLEFRTVNCAVGSSEGKGDFVFSRGRGSMLKAEEKASARNVFTVDVKTVDGILNGDECTLIKYDVEGAEENALLGSTETIRKHKPALIVASYHTQSDIYSIPLLIKSISENYNIYLRHHPCLPSWETNVYALYKS